MFVSAFATPTDRRKLLRSGLRISAVLATGGTPVAAMARGLARRHPERALRLYNLHTDEQVHTVYWAKGRYLPEGLAEISTCLRDRHSGEIKPIDPKLLDLLAALHGQMDSKAPIEVYSGYRSPQTNAKLALAHSGVAKNSLHMAGLAVDVALADRDLADQHRAARALKAGGVGYYPKSGVLHLDVGPLRRWVSG